MPELHPLLSPPDSEAQLLTQARQLAGYSLGELATMAGLVTPRDLKRDKGWIGVLLEIWLGASAGSKPEQDFGHCCKVSDEAAFCLIQRPYISKTLLT
ncbi:hypothetical protein SJ436_17445, partial [Citrobacter cronae]|nr:hypothetical protein [Citrobacter cronae]